MTWYSTDVSLYLFFILTGMCSGFLSGLLSIGGAFVMVPAFLAIFGHFYHFESHFLMQLTLGTTMACMIVTAISSTSAQHKRHSVYWEFVKANWMFISAGTVIGVLLTNVLPTSLIKICFAAFCLFSGYKMIRRKNSYEIPMRPAWAKYVSVAFGTLCGFIGVGGANLFIPYLMKTEAIELKKAMGTASAIQIPISIIGAISYLLLGIHASHVDSLNIFGYIYLPVVILVSLAGYYFNKLGVVLAHRLPVQKLKMVFGGFTMLIGLRMAYSALS